MSRTRREFLVTTAAAGLGALALQRGALGEGEAAPAAKTLLILGGTAFLGPALVEAASVRGYSITLFNRGKTNPGLFPDLETLHGDRDGKLDALKGRAWDAVVDTSGYVPRIVRDSATLLAPAVKQYVFISSISVYADFAKPGMDESAPVGTLADESVEQVTGETYGPLKALCEKAAEKAMPGRTLVVRPGLIVGPGDPSDRFTYWPVRVRKGGEVLAPGSPADPIQFVDVRDLAEWTIRMVDARTNGVFHATGPKETLSMGAFLETCKKVSGSDATLTFADAAFLAEQNVSPWGDMPAWVPAEGDTAGLSRVDCARAIRAGLSFRPVASTVGDTLAWWDTLPEGRRGKLKAGIKPEREAEVLAAWHARQAK